MIRVLAFLLMALVWGGTWLPVKIAAADAPPVFVAAVRFILAGLCFLAWCLALRLPLRTSRPWRLAAASLLITTGCYSLLFWGVAHAPSGLSAVVNMGLLPVFTILIGTLYGEERITGRRVAAIALGIVGLAILFSGRRTEPAGGMVALGLGAVALASLSYAWGAVLSRPLMRDMAPAALAFWQTSLGGLALLPLSVLTEGFDPARAAALFRGGPLLGLLYLVLFGSLVGFTVYLWLVRDWGAFRAGLYAFLSPMVAVLLGVV